MINQIERKHIESNIKELRNFIRSEISKNYNFNVHSFTWVEITELFIEYHNVVTDMIKEQLR